MERYVYWLLWAVPFLATAAAFVLVAVIVLNLGHTWWADRLFLVGCIMWFCGAFAWVVSRHYKPDDI